MGRAAVRKRIPGEETLKLDLKQDFSKRSKSKPISN